MGTGVSVLRVDSAQCGDFVRVGGTACGGGTFLGLARLLTSATSFEEALEMASWGDASNAEPRHMGEWERWGRCTMMKGKEMERGKMKHMVQLERMVEWWA
eukprot:g8827.t1